MTLEASAEKRIPPADRAVIVAAGRGSRMGALAEGRPKCLVEFLGMRLIDWQIAALRQALASSDDIAAVILEPTGTHFGLIPLASGYIEAARELTAEKAVLLIFDEVISGFRIGPGGAQGHFGVTPDMSTHAKIACGGLPGGVVCGRKDILDVLDFDAMAGSGE